MESPISQECPEGESLVRFCEGTLPRSHRDAVETHLAECDFCSHRISELALELPSLAGTSAVSRRVLGWNRWGAATAAGVAICAGLTSVWLSGPSQPPRRPETAGFSPVKLLAGIDETIRTPAGSGQVFALPDGTRLRAGPDTALRFVPPRGDERIHIELAAGTLEADVAKGRGTFRVAGPVGEIRVLGTRFAARAFDLGRDSGVVGFEPVSVFFAEVYEGAVALENAQGTARLDAGWRGVILGNEPPVKQERTESFRTILDRFEETVEKANGTWRIRPGREYPCRLMAAAFWGSRWDPEPDPERDVPAPLLALRFGIERQLKGEQR